MRLQILSVAMLLCCHPFLHLLGRLVHRHCCGC